MSIDREKLTIEDYNFIFSCIHNKYTEYCKKWISDREEVFNLKKLQVRDIYFTENNAESEINEKFEIYLSEFKSGLVMLYLSILSEIQQNTNIETKAKFSGREKTQESVYNKLHRKMVEDGGTFSINKYLNDLLGFRIIDPYYNDNIQGIKQLLSKYRENGYKITHKPRSNKGYEAYHIYFKECNSTFPVEIQIWDMENEYKNLEMHSVYKQEYVAKIINDYNKF